MISRFAVALLILLMAATATPRGLADEQVLNGIAAVVNSEVITFAEVQEMVGAREQALEEQYKGQELADKVKDLRMQAVQLLIDNKLIIQDFNKNKYSIPDYVVEEQVQARIKDQFGGDRAAFLRTMEAQGMTMEKLRKMVKDEIIVQAMRQQSVKDDTIIAPAKIKDYYDAHIADYSTPEQVHLRMIVIKKNGDSGRQMAEEVRQKVLGGADFDKLAEMYSEDSTQSSGGDWGWIDRKTLNDQLTNVAFSLKPGEVSKVIELAGSYYLLYVEAKKNATEKSLVDVHDDIENKLLEDQRQKAQEKWIAGLREKAYIKVY
ncbi:MAG TPA: peptidyl-prolyl cis-trans isomerase [Chthoniobacteraceae bacterium]|jgi:peptidyl-prolyl cis-trans isomerase SurA|nr:peptidyl-prolyl cis-trans isomerase [Chthoniobacteraceae bacterium]